MERETGISGAQSSNEMVFECSNASFSCIATMDAWGCCLKFNVFSCKEIFQDFAAFIVQTMELWSAPSGDKEVIAFLICLQDCRCFAIRDRLCMNCVAVIMV